MAEKSASATWSGTLTEGSGTFSAESGLFKNAPISWASRTNEARGQTSPEEVLAAAHAACYSMALAHNLQNNHMAAESLEVTATVGFGPKPGGGMKVTHSHLKVVGKVPGLDAEAFAKVASDAGTSCPISGALHGNVEITVDATLA